MALRIATLKTIPVTIPLLIPGKRLGVNLIPQRQTQWCWAACTQMILDFYHAPNVEQCDLANLAFSDAGGGCCNFPSSTLCNKPLCDTRISKLFDQQIVNIKHYYVNKLVPFTTLQYELDRNRPVQIGLSTIGGGHVIIIEGWYPTDKGSYLNVNNPLPVSEGYQGVIAYSELEKSYGWNATWTRLTR